MKINELVGEMLRLSHLLFFSRTWHLIDGTLLSMQIASPWLVFVFVCGKMYLKMEAFLTVSITVGAVPSCRLCWLGTSIFPARTTRSAQPSCRFFLLCCCSFSPSVLLPPAPSLRYLGRFFNLQAFCQKMEVAYGALRG